ncbi:hypothetical protein MYOV002v2_p0115 [Vibrio phage 144E46.1]|nr:hypothetical protein MYOV002v2_p0115 [Vibrio phage 144E46.1]
MKLTNLLLLGSVALFGVFTVTQIDQYKAAQVDHQYTLVAKGQECGRSCFNWGIFRNGERQTLVNIGTTGQYHYKVGRTYTFRLNYTPILGIAGTAYTPIETSTAYGMASIFSLIFSIIGAVMYYVRRSEGK